MALVRINRFGGMIPKLSKRHITHLMAQVATNCILTTRSLRPLREPLFVQNALNSAIKSIYLFNDVSWFQWSEDVDVLRSQIAGNQADDPVPFERTYFTGSSKGKPQVTDSSIATSSGNFPSASYHLGIPAPTVAPIASTPTASDPDVVNTVRYVYTYVRIWNGVESEGPPSPASNETTVTPGDNVNVSGLANISELSGTNVTHKRIYRVATSDIGGAFQFVAQVAIALSSYADKLKDVSLGIVLASLTWSPPPDDLHSIVNMPNGMMAGLSGNRLCFSEPYQPHAWPLEYRIGLAYTGVSLAGFGQSVVVSTDGLPYVATGVHPAAVSLDKIEIKQACLNKQSTVDMGEYIVYASANGLVSLGIGINNILTRDYFTKKEWIKLNPSSMRGYHYDGQYICFYDTGTKKAGFVFDPTNPEAGYTELDFYATAGFNDPQTDDLYLVIGGQIVNWDKDIANSKTYIWRSGVVIAARPSNPGVAQVIAASYPVTFELIGDEVTRLTLSVQNASAFRLPSGYLAKDFEVEITGTSEVYEVLVGDTVEDLKRV